MTENSAPRPRTVLLTGALGNIGRILREPLAARYGSLRSTDLRAPGALVTGEQFVEGTLADPQFARSVTQGVDTVVHMAGTSEEDDWAPVLANNVSRSEEHTSELQSLMRISYAVFCLKKKKNINKTTKT